MSPLLWLFLLFSTGCTQKLIQTEFSQVSSVQDLLFLNDCSQIRAVNSNLWLLTCQRPPHADRTEVYEWSFDSKKLKRLTYQDGQIWDISPIDKNHFYYSSSYDEFKEQFASILNGAKPGSDIYLKNRTQTNFERVTHQKGLEISFFWYNPKNLLYFVHETENESQIMTLNSKKQLQMLYSVPKKNVRNPIILENNKTLYWIEYDPNEKGAVIKSQNKSKKIIPLYQSDSRIFQLAVSPNPDQLLVGFATGIGVEIWNLNLKESCWKLAYRIADPVSEFYVMNDKILFLTVKNGLKQDHFLEPSEVCYPSPPGLGVNAL
jgi:hypothetical protein